MTLVIEFVKRVTNSSLNAWFSRASFVRGTDVHPTVSQASSAGSDYRIHCDPETLRFLPSKANSYYSDVFVHFKVTL